MAAPPTSVTAPALLRAVGGLSLTAIAINAMVGAGIFTMPAAVARVLGPASPLAYLVAGTGVALIALCFAEAGSQCETSGGPYLYARAAFGEFVGFEVGWMFTLSRVTAIAAVSNIFSAYLGYFLPSAAQGVGRAIALTAIIAALGTVNYLGIRPGVMLINTLTIGKLIPLAVFCVAGLFFLDSRSYSFRELPQPGALQQGSLLVLFALSGFEAASVVSAEVIRVRRTLPLALIGSVGLVVALYLAVQLVAMGTLPALSDSQTPLASAAQRFLGPLGALLLTVGALFSTTGTNCSIIVVAPRMIYAMAEGGRLPAFLKWIHPRYRTPAASILAFVLPAWALALSGNFAELATLTSLGRLIFYTSTCLAVPVLRRKIPSAERKFTLPGGALIPVLAVGVCGWLLAGSPLNQAAITVAALAAGAALYGLSSTWRTL